MAQAEAMAIPKGSWVLVTAANGYTGSHVVIELLGRGFKVRGTVRDLESSQWLLNDDFVAPFARRGDLELLVADIRGRPAAFEAAVRGVSAVIHIAVMGDMTPDPDVGISSTVEMGMVVCRAAAREPSVRRFVFASSFYAAAFPTPGVRDLIRDRETWNEAALAMARAPPPYGPERVVPVYCAAKAEAEKAIWRFVDEEKAAGRLLGWEVNSVSPCTILGDLRHEKHLRGMPPQFQEALYLGHISELMKGTPAQYYAHVKDVGVINVAAVIDPDVSGHRIQVLARSFNWDDCLAIHRRAYPDRQFVDDFLSGESMTYEIENDIAPGLIRKWAGRDWIDLETGVRETIDYVVRHKKLP